ncbi:minichromosome maintenance- protein, partial [Kappamyces sp. JEL0680]
FLEINHILDYAHDDGIAGDWITVGILYHKSRVLWLEKSRVHLVVFSLTDLRGAHFRLFLAGEAFEEKKNQEIGSVVALLNCKVLRPSQSQAVVGLLIDSAQNYLYIGKSVDLGWCKQHDCTETIDLGLKAVYCPEHRDGNYRAARHQRQELAVGNSLFQVGPPAVHTKEKRRTMGWQGLYKIGSDLVAAEGYRVSVREPLKPTTQRAGQDQM